MINISISLLNLYSMFMVKTKIRNSYELKQFLKDILYKKEEFLIKKWLINDKNFKINLIIAEGKFNKINITFNNNWTILVILNWKKYFKNLPIHNKNEINKSVNLVFDYIKSNPIN